MEFDSILKEIGEFGAWQKQTIVLLWIPAMFCGIHNLLSTFTGLEPQNGYRCRIEECDTDEDFSFYDYSSGLYPEKNGKPDYCSYYRPRVCGEDNFTSTEVKCKKYSDFAFGKFEYSSSLVTEWNQVCHKTPSVSFVQTFYIFGLFVGSFLCGKLADRYGRRPTLLLAILVSSTGDLLGSFMPEFWSYSATRFLAGVGQQGVFNMTFAITIEILGQTARVPCLPWVSLQTCCGLCVSAGFTVGYVLLSAVASLYVSWFPLQLTVGVVSFIQVFVWFMLPESPRWLLSVDKWDEAETLIRAAAKKNGRELPPDWRLLRRKKVDPREEEEEGGNMEPGEERKEQYGFTHLFDRRIVIFTIIQMLAWPAVSLCYFGLSYGASSLQGDVFVNSVILSCVEFPAYLYAILLIDIWGRKPVFSLSLTFTGTAIITSAFLQDQTVRNILVYIAKNTTSASFGIVFLYTSELLPTALRSSGLGLCSLMARLGALFSPLLGILADATSIQVPMYILGGFAILSGILSIIFLPETLGSGLPEDLDDIAKLKANSKSMWRCASKD